MTPLRDPAAEAIRIMDAAESRKVILRLFGGLSFFYRCPSAKTEKLQRTYVDIDFMAHSKQSREITKLFVELGYVGRERFNAMMGHKRLIFNDMENQRRIDIFLDVFDMCHTFNFKDRLGINGRTISLSDMLTTKLQIIEMSDKDIKDILCVFIDYDVGDKDAGMINGAYLARLCGEDWGIYRTFMLNLDRILSALPQLGLEARDNEVIKGRVERLRKDIEVAPKSFGWKMRARVGDKVQWYKLPEADREVVDSRLASAKPNGSQ